MCGRFFIDYEFREIVEKYGLSKYNTKTTKGEIFPGNEIMVVVNDYGVKMKWGFDFDWSSRKIINARSETIFEKNSFKDLIIHRRCIIPISSYFEWENIDGEKIKHEIKESENKISSLAGIYQITEKDNDEKEFKFTILTTDAIENIKYIHKRMPLIINKENEKIWLDKKITNNAILLNAMKNTDFNLSEMIV
ncbi:SOS response-associated peptidase [Clostridiaceae bacterium HSG29]|nr:SOS response-associated peptidase [Clostridiaceae bacterium HSG29]